MDIADQDINVIMETARHTLETLQDMDNVERVEKIQDILEITRNTLETLRDNEKSANTFHAIESRILSVLNFKDLFVVLLSEIKNQFKVPFVWVTILQETEVSTMMTDALDGSEKLQKNLNFIDKATFMGIIENNFTPLLINDDLRHYSKLFPEGRYFLVKSMTIAPITLDGEIIGSLNLADINPERYTPDLDSSLIRKLAMKMSQCLSNVVAHEKIKFLAYNDTLTNLPNRRSTETSLEREYKRAQRYNNPLSVVFMDLDYFKRVNDTYGHEQGDELLKYLSRNLSQMVRQSDTIGRFAGDEFVAILPETEMDEAHIQMNRIQKWFSENPLCSDQERIPISISFGIASTKNDESNSAKSLLKIADNRLYEVKHSRVMAAESAP
ncbi:MAG: diguanylate cyclase [Thermodesulfobacteriota bacterium]